MTDLERAVKQRGGVRGRLTVISKTLESALHEKDYDKLEANLDLLANIQHRLEDLNLRVEDLIAVDQVENDVTISMELFEAAQILTQRVKKVMTECRTVDNVKEVRTAIKLPKLQFTVFDGNITLWTGFYETFLASVRDNKNLSIIEKINYLRSMLSGVALKTISGFSLSNENYNLALSLLKERFGNSQTIVETHIKQICNIKCNNISNLRKFYDECIIHIRSLDSLQIKSSKYNMVIGPILLANVPTEIALLWARNNREQEIVIEDFFSFIKAEVETREKVGMFTFKDLSVNVSREPLKTRTSTYGTATTLKTSVRSNEIKCLLCGEPHKAVDCTYDVNKRLAVIRQNKLCFNCLRRNHVVSDCQAKGRCFHCQKKHCTSICRDNQGQVEHSNGTSNRKTTDESESQGEILPTTPTAEVSNLHVNVGPDTILQTLIVEITNGSNPNYKCTLRAILDTASQRSFITENASRNLKLVSSCRESLCIQGFGNTSTSQGKFKRHQVTICSPEKPSSSVKLNVVEVPSISKALSHANLSEEELNQIKGLNLADAKAITDTKSFEIDLLIGSDHYWDVVEGDIRRLNCGLVAQKTKFGWVLNGKKEDNIHYSDCDLSYPISLLVNTTEENLNQNIQNFWKLESIGITDNYNSQNNVNESFISEFERTIQHQNGRYVVELPWKENIKSELPTNYNIAKSRLLNQTKRMSQDSAYLLKYSNAIQEYIDMNVAELVEPKKEGVHYLSHHAIIRQSHPTTPIRIVFDGSAKMQDKPCINDCLYTGPSLVPDLMELVLKFRQHPIAISADIEKAFLQILISQKDRDYLRFLWICPEEFKTHSKVIIKEYRITRVLFGLNCSPFLLAATINYHLKRHKDKYKDIITKIEGMFYVDDLICGIEKEEEIAQFIEQAKELFSLASMNLRKWKSNSSQVPCKTICSPDKTKILGITWNLQDDTLQPNFKAVLDYAETAPSTKRALLSTVSRIFDPIGFFTPITMVAKCLFQQLWESGVQWDEDLPETILKQWKAWLQSIKTLHNISIPRQVSRAGQVTDLQVFCDASSKGYAAVAYLVINEINYVDVKLIMSKARVAPLKRLTIPKLELLAAVLGVRLAHFIKRQFLYLNSVTYWTDALDVIYWIRSHSSTWKQFVGNRVQEIQTHSSPSQWYHVPGKQNPADLPSRGVMGNKLDDMWWFGPSWLKDKRLWPEQGKLEPAKSALLEKCKTKTICLLTQEIQPLKPIFEPDKFGNLTKLLNVTAYVLRFVKGCKGVKSGNSLLLSSDVEEAKTYWCAVAQQSKFWDEYVSLKTDGKISKKSVLCKSGPFINPSTGLMVAQGRLTEIEGDAAPVILPKDHFFSVLIIQNIHLNRFHGGISDTLAELRTTYYIHQGRQLVKRVLHQCTVCRRFNTKPFIQKEAPMPSDRIIETPPFNHVGIDFAGPLYTKDCEKKNYICLFTCAVTQAIHLELVKGLTCPEFIMALKRFIARRGVPSKIYSDNAKTFVRAKKDIKTMWNSNADLSSELVKNRIEWKFIAPRAPWWGGWWERLVGLFKSRLKKSLGLTHLNNVGQFFAK